MGAALGTTAHRTAIRVAPVALLESILRDRQTAAVRTATLATTARITQRALLGTELVLLASIRAGVLVAAVTVRQESTTLTLLVLRARGLVLLASIRAGARVGAPLAHLASTNPLQASRPAAAVLQAVMEVEDLHRLHAREHAPQATIALPVAVPRSRNNVDPTLSFVQQGPVPPSRLVLGFTPLDMVMSTTPTRLVRRNVSVTPWDRTVRVVSRCNAPRVALVTSMD